jgi:hypothetical protein
MALKMMSFETVKKKSKQSPGYWLPVTTLVLYHLGFDAMLHDRTRRKGIRDSPSLTM